MSTDPFSDDDDFDPDQSSAGWQPLLEKPGFEQWWDGADWRGRPHREPDPFSAFTPELARSLRPGPNRAAAMARVGIVTTIAGFVLQTVVASGVIMIDGVAPLALTLGAIALAAVAAIVTAVAASVGLRAAPRLGGRAMSSVALGVSILLGLAPVLLLVAIALAGGV